jgi:hypothetical protein
MPYPENPEDSTVADRELALELAASLGIDTKMLDPKFHEYSVMESGDKVFHH